MRIYKNVIDIDQLCFRDRDICRKDVLPKKLSEARGILIKEDKSILPSYQAMPHPVHNIAHKRGVISDEEYDEELRKVGFFARKSDMYNMKNLVEGLLCNGTKVYLSCIWLSDDLNSDNPAVLTIESKEWDYYFKPKIFNIGRSGRILKNKNGEEYAEELYIKTTPEMMWGSLCGGLGIHAERIAIHTKDGRLEQIIEDGEIIESAFDESEIDFKSKFREKSNFLDIDLEKLSIPEGLSVKEHPFVEKLRDYKGGIFIFETNFDDWRDLFIYVNSFSNNIVWKALQLYHHCWSEHPDGGGGNSFFRKALGFPHYHWVFYESDAEARLGYIGREVRIADDYNKEYGFEASSNWQSQYLDLKFGRELLLPAMFLLGDALKRIALNKSLVLRSGYQVFYDKNNPKIIPENPVTIYEEPCSVLQRQNEQPSQAAFF